MSAGQVPSAPQRSLLLSFVLAQLGVHAVMAGLRMAMPLQALREGYSAWAVGAMLALFSTVPILFALRVGRFIDRTGYHRPVRLAASIAALGGLAAVGATYTQGEARFALWCLAALLAGGAANMSMLAVQRTAGLSARDAVERVKVFSVLGVAPSLSNVVGPVMSGLLIDHAGFAWAYGVTVLLTGLSWWATARVPAHVARFVNQKPPGERTQGSVLHATPGLKRLLLVNWMLSMSWDVHTFAVPVLGHERGISASNIGFVLGLFTACVTAMRLCLPLVAHRVSEARWLNLSMWGTAWVFLIYPLAHQPWQMAACALMLGLALGGAQPMVMSTLHHLTPRDRQGEALALRSMTINVSSTFMPLMFGALGAVTGVAPLFWLVGAVVGVGSWSTRGLADTRQTPGH